jgi:hypothetical protein
MAEGEARKAEEARLAREAGDAERVAALEAELRVLAEERRKADEAGARGVGASGEAKGMKDAGPVAKAPPAPPKPTTPGELPRGGHGGGGGSGFDTPTSTPAPEPAPTPDAPMLAPGDELAGALDARGRAEGWSDKERKEQAEKAAQAIRSSVKVVEGRTFYLVDGYWTDVQWKKGTTGKEPRKVKYLSDEYFKLLAENPSLGTYFALGERVRVVHGADAFEVAE